MTFARRHHPNPAREQWDRAERWLARLRVLVATRATGVEDFGLVVLHHCWSMHDWLVKGLRSPTDRSAAENRYTQAEVEGLFQTAELRACRLMANAAKHLDLDPKMNAGRYDGTIQREWAGSSGVNLIAIAGNEYELIELCTTCMAQIRHFLTVHGWDLPISGLVPEIVPA
jgi:hypothetical protein